MADGPRKPRRGMAELRQTQSQALMLSLSKHEGRFETFAFIGSLV